MKILKFILLFIAGIIALLLIIAMFVKKEYTVETEVVIDKPLHQVFDYVKCLENQFDYGAWYVKDTTLVKETSGDDGEPGFIIRWDSEMMGKGEQEILSITDNERIDFELRFIKPFKTTNHTWFVTYPMNDEQTLVRWGFQGRFPYPLNSMLLFFDMEKGIGSDFQEGLNNMKRILEFNKELP